MSSVPTIDQFAEVLSKEPKWYDFGVFLEVPVQELDSISRNYHSEGIRRCLIELYKCAVNVYAEREKPLTWDHVAETLRRMKNHHLASDISVQYLLPSPHSPEPALQEVKENLSQVDHVIEIDVPPEVAKMFFTVVKMFTALTVTVNHALSVVPLEDLQHLITQTCELEPLSGKQATHQNVIRRLSSYYCFLNLDILELVSGALVAIDEPLHSEISQYKKLVDQFKFLVEMKHLAGLVTEKEKGEGSSQKKVTLKLREFWSKVTFQKFKQAMQEILKTLYKCASHITVEKGCICVSWLVPDRPSSNYIVPDPEDKEFIKLIGVVFLHIDNDVIYDIPGDGCETMEAALLQAIELKNKQAIELLIFLGCDSGIGVYNEHVSITTIVEIGDREKAAGSVKHDHVFGQSIQVFLCTDGNSQQSPEKMLGSLLQENEVLKLLTTAKNKQWQR